MDRRDILREQQRQPRTVSDYAAETAKEMAYRQSEEYNRKQWEAEQDRWEAKAKKEGWHYSRRPFIGALERAQQAEEAKQRRIAELREELERLEGNPA